MRSHSLRTRRTKSLCTGNPVALEYLESRVLLSATPAGLVPAQVRHAYGFDQLSLSGIGQTIAIVTAYDAPTIAADLNVFDTLFNVDNSAAASTFFTKVAMSSRLRANAGWSQETALDVEWAHAIAPGAHIVLVEAASSGMNDLMAAVNYARNVTGVSVVSMSWGGSEFSSEKSFDSYFTTPAGHTGVTFVAAAGDVGGAVSYPAVSPNVLAVGGTTLHTAAGGSYTSEIAWSDSGGGYSKTESAIAGQEALTGSTRRGSPDVSYDANPSTGFSVYDSYAYQGDSGWMTFGGTSAGTPQWAGLIADANQGRAIAGETSLNGATQTLPAIYSVSASDFHDVTSGSTSSSIAAGAGYDLATGRGSPIANALIPDLVAYTGSTSATAAVTRVTTTTTRGSVTRQLAVVQISVVALPTVAALTDESAATSNVPAVIGKIALPALHENSAAAPVITLQESTRTFKPTTKTTDDINTDLA